jgi:hypothetical protein
MEGYLGNFPIDITAHPVYSKYTPADWAMEYIERYGQIDGAHHKTWVLDHVARILKGTAVIVEQARWSPNDQYPEGLMEDRISLADPSPEYLEWVEMMKGDWDEENEWFEYNYDEGIAP